MSGRKCSNISLDSELERRRQYLGQIQSHQQDIAGVRRQVFAALNDTTRGVREHFAKEAATAELWLKSTNNLAALSDLDLSSSVSVLSQRLSKLQSIGSEGLALQASLEEAFVQQAGQLRAEAAKLIFHADTLLSRGDEIIRLWFGTEEVERSRATLDQARQDLEADRLEPASKSLNNLNADLITKLRLSENNESKHQQRLYILKALRKVSEEMGFQEIKPVPSDSEANDDRKRRIAVTFDTFNRGEVTFYLSLESIEVDSCISPTHCFEEFSQLSEQLAETFGVITKFQTLDGEAAPSLIRKGELEEPNGMKRSLKRS
jgi:hypothetical protein